MTEGREVERRPIPTPPMTSSLFLDYSTVSTIQDNGEVCCPTCGSWSHLSDLRVSDFGTEVYCPLCDNREEARR